MPIAVIVDERRPGAPARFFADQSGVLRYIGEGSVAIVPIEFVLSPVRNEQILEPVVVVVADTNARRPADVGKSGTWRSAGEGAVAIIFVQPIGSIRGRAGEQRAG